MNVSLKSRSQKSINFQRYPDWAIISDDSEVKKNERVNVIRFKSYFYVLLMNVYNKHRPPLHIKLRPSARCCRSLCAIQLQ